MRKYCNRHTGFGASGILKKTRMSWSAVKNSQCCNCTLHKKLGSTASPELNWNIVLSRDYTGISYVSRQML